MPELGDPFLHYQRLRTYKALAEDLDDRLVKLAKGRCAASGCRPTHTRQSADRQARDIDELNKPKGEGRST